MLGTTHSLSLGLAGCSLRWLVHWPWFASSVLWVVPRPVGFDLKSTTSKLHSIISHATTVSGAHLCRRNVNVQRAPMRSRSEHFPKRSAASFLIYANSRLSLRWHKNRTTGRRLRPTTCARGLAFRSLLCFLACILFSSVCGSCLTRGVPTPFPSHPPLLCARYERPRLEPAHLAHVSKFAQPQRRRMASFSVIVGIYFDHHFHGLFSGCVQQRLFEHNITSRQHPPRIRQKLLPVDLAGGFRMVPLPHLPLVYEWA